MAYDNRDRVSSVTDVFGQVVSYQYDADSNRTQLSLNAATSATYQYDAINRLTHAKAGNTLADFQDQLNAVNNITQMTDGAGAHNYSYDSVDRLTAATHPNQTNESYTFDDVGNRTASHQGSSYSYQAFNRLVTANSSLFSYAANGNLTANTKTIFRRQEEAACIKPNRLWTATCPPGTS